MYCILIFKEKIMRALGTNLRQTRKQSLLKYTKVRLCRVALNSAVCILCNTVYSMKCVYSIYLLKEIYDLVCTYRSSIYNHN